MKHHSKLTDCVLIGESENYILVPLPLVTLNYSPNRIRPPHVLRCLTQSPERQSESASQRFCGVSTLRPLPVFVSMMLHLCVA